MVKRNAFLRWNHPLSALLTFLALFIPGFLLTACSPLEAGEDVNQAGLVIQHGNGQITTACVAFSEASISGEELLLRSGLEYSIDAGNPMGTLVCSLDGEGCDFPAQDCFCRCRGAGGCRYWAYFNQTDSGEWRYSPLGASVRNLEHGDMDAWIWITSTSRGEEAIPPGINDYVFGEICPPDARPSPQP